MFFGLFLVLECERVGGTSDVKRLVLMLWVVEVETHGVVTIAVGIEAFCDLTEEGLLQASIVGWDKRASLSLLTAVCTSGEIKVIDLEPVVDECNLNLDVEELRIWLLEGIDLQIFLWSLMHFLWT